MSGGERFCISLPPSPLSQQKKNKNHIENYASHYRYYLSIINP